jgi:transcriptional regulator with XRE-family HTH domain
MQTTINQRVKILIDHFAEGNQRDFAKAIGLSPSTINTVIGSRQTKPGYEIINAIISRYDNVNTEWLFKGTGEMLLTDQQQAKDKQPANAGKEKNGQAAKYKVLLAVQEDQAKYEKLLKSLEEQIEQDEINLEIKRQLREKLKNNLRGIAD